MDKVLIIGAVWPEPKSSAAGVRMMQLIELFRQMNLEVIFASNTPRSEFMVDLELYGVRTCEVALNCDSFDAFVVSVNPAVVVFDRFITEEQFGWRVAQFVPNAVRILDTEDLHFLRRFRMNHREAVLDIDALKLEDDTKRELLSILRCDLSILISDFEYKLLVEEFGVAEEMLFLLDFPEPDVFEASGFDDKLGFCFIGNFNHKPNVEAVRLLKKEVWPRIFELNKNLKLYVYGAYPSMEMMQFNDPKQHFYVVGRVADASIALNAHRVLLAPLTFGAGVKGKVVDAIGVDTVVLSTNIGFEGFGDLNAWSHFTGCSMDDFAEKAIEFHENKNSWEAARDEQNLLMQQYFGANKTEQEFVLKLEYLLKYLKNHRNRNYIVNLLNYDTINSKKYLSKWIIIKNNINIK